MKLILTKSQKKLRRRILEISFKNNFSHLGSCLSAVDLIDCIYKFKKKRDKFVLSNGHAAVGLYVVLEKYGFIKDPKITYNLHVHPDRNPKLGIDVSTGSLGHGLPIALGMALANRKNTTYCMISDGECAEGSIWETLRIISQYKINNLKVILNANGWGAYDPISLQPLVDRLTSFGFKVIKVNGHDQKSIIKALKTPTREKPTLIFSKTSVEQLPFLKGQGAHYYIMNNEDYNLAMEVFK